MNAFLVCLYAFCGVSECTFSGLPEILVCLKHFGVSECIFGVCECILGSV